MIFLKLFLTSGLTFLTAMATTDFLLNYIKPEHYNIKLNQYAIEFGYNNYYGECNVNINILQATHIINFHSETQCITNIELTDNPPRFRFKYDSEMIVYKPIEYLRDNKTQIIKFSFINELPSGRYILNMKFAGTIADYGGFRTMSSMEGENIGWIAATHFQRIGARRLFPCWDKPELKATFNISILHNRKYRVFSNMPMQKMKYIRNIMSWKHFQTTPAISTYLVAAVVIRAKLFYVSKTETINMWYRMAASSHLLYAEEVIKSVTLYLKSEWKRSQMITKVNHVAIPNFQDKNMNFGLVLYRESDILYNENSDPIARKIEVAHLLRRKIAQEWFSNVLNSSLNSSSWINEALLPFIEMNIINKALPNIRMMDLFVVQIQQECLHLDADYNMWPLMSRTNNSIEIPCHNKALILLRMLQHIITETEFWNAVHKYFHNKEPSYEVSQDIILIAINQHTLTNLTEIMDVWVKHIFKHYPVINIMRGYDNPTSFINISMQNFNISSDYLVPLTYTTEKKYEFEKTFSYLLLTKQMPSLTYGLAYKEDGWIIFNIQQTGYYRVNYDKMNWQRISNYLDSENYIRIHVLNRAQIIDDAFHLVIARKLDSSIFWNLTTYLYREKDYVAWYPMFKALEYMSSVFPLQKQKVDKIKEKMREILKVLFEKLEYEDSFSDNKVEDLQKCLRQEIAKWACFFESSVCLNEASHELNEHLETPNHRLLPWWKQWTYCNGLRAIEANSWSTIYNMMENHTDYKILTFLSCSKNPKRIRNYLNLIKDLIKNNEITSKIYPQVQLNLQVESNLVNSFLVTIAKHAMNNDILIYILINFGKIKPRQINTIASLTVIINNIYSMEQLTEVSEYANEAIKMKHFIINDLVILTNEEREVWETMLQHVPQIREKIKLRQSEIENQLTYLETLSN